MVSAVCLAVRQTILVCFFPENCGFAGKEKRQMYGKLKMHTRRLLVQIHPCQVLSVKSFTQLKNVQFFDIYFTSDGLANTVISRRACMISWFPECWKSYFRASRFQNFLGEHAARAPQVKRPDGPLFIQSVILL